MHISILTQLRGWVQLYPIAVSILTQPGGWVQRFNPSTFCLLTFQSSPNLLVGCIWAMEVFQLLRSWAMTPVFSILAQPLGWVQRLTCALWALFQSSLNLLAGCSWHSVIGLDQGCCSFNPHPTSRLGASADEVVTIGDLVTVSILTQPLGWV